MARSKAKKSPRKPMDPALAARLRQTALWVLISTLVIGGGGTGFVYLKRYVEQKVVLPSEPPVVVLKNRPVWMSDFLSEQIAASARPQTTSTATDATMLREAYNTLQTNPWVHKVKQVRRVYGKNPGDTLEIDCEYRAPVALVEQGGEYWLVDGEGVKLPEKYTPIQIPRIIYGQDGKVNIRIIEGITTKSPRGSGAKWSGDDLAAALDLARLLSGQSFAEEIVKIDMSNFEGRQDPREPQIILGTRNQTTIRWGEPLKQTFHAEVSAAEKLNRLARLRQEKGRIDAGYAWIDIRMDKILVPTPPPAAPAGEIR